MFLFMLLSDAVKFTPEKGSVTFRTIRDGESDAPGFCALRYPPMTAMGFLMLHLVFGMIVGASYGALAG